MTFSKSLSMFIVLSILCAQTSFAITWPSTPPPGEVAGGKIGNYINSVKNLIFPDNGKIGIGTSSPAKLFEVYDEGSIGAVQVTTDSTVGLRVSSKTDGNILFWVKSNNSAINRDVLMVPNGDGNVGIGTTGPLSKLHVQGEVPNIILKDMNNAVVGGTYGQIEFRTSDASSYNVDRIQAKIDSHDDSIYGDRGTLRFYTTSGDDLQERVRIASDGSVGIGPPTPNETLQISGAVNLGTTTNTNAGSIRWTGTDFEGYNGTEWVSFSSTGSDCGENVQDADGNWYNTVKVGTQCWMAQNMRTTRYPDGTAITKGDAAHGAATWTTDTAQYSCPPNTSNNGEDCAAAESLGMFYQWSAAMKGVTTAGAQGICPTGWHVPTDSEQHTLDNYLATGTCNASRSNAWDCNPAGDKLKLASNCTSGSNCGLSGFGALLSGFRDTNGLYYDRGTDTYYWSSSESGSSAWVRALSSGLSTVGRSAYNSKARGFSVRCIKD